MFETIKEDIATIKNRDPAARSALEIMFLYSGYKAVRSYRKPSHSHRRVPEA